MHARCAQCAELSLLDKAEAQARYAGWRGRLLCFRSAELERQFLQFYAGTSPVLTRMHNPFCTACMRCAGARLQESSLACAAFLREDKLLPLTASILCMYRLQQQ